MINYITWTVDPILFHLGSIKVAWYSIFFGVSLIIIGYAIVEKMWQHEQLPERWLNYLFLYTILGTIVGARLGHCLFYDPQYYLANPLEILQTWKGGLASHGGVIGIIICIYFYSKKVTHKSMLWTFDRLVVPTGLVAGMIRLGNLMNHEIYGHPTDLPWGFRFITNIPQWQAGADPIFSLPSHPTQIYEALAYFAIFGICMYLYWKRDIEKRTGLLFGIFMIWVFTFRFFVEFVKNPQESFEYGMTLNMGQLLSIPFILVGIASVVYALKRPATPLNLASKKQKK